jgi:ADP-ribosylation factor GTPase-activating protein 2/3
MSRYPEEVVITDVPDVVSSESNTPAGEDDDFFSSWDKPTIKRPSNPPSRTGTPRAQSPFLKPGAANGNGTDRPKSPLVAAESTTPAVVKPTVRKTTAGAAPKKNILGAKKKGLGAKKVVAADGGLDFEEAERKAREEAERIEKLGYDPDAEAAETAAATKPKAAEASNIAAPTPVSPPRGGFGSTAKPDRWADTEEVGRGVARLGFGQVGAAKKAAPAKKIGGFGSVSKPVEDDSEKYARQKFGTQKGISSDEFFGRNNFDPAQSAQAKERLSGTLHILGILYAPTDMLQASKEHQPFPPTPTLVDLRMTFQKMTTAIWRVLPRTLYASSVSLLVTISRTCRTCLAKVPGNCRALSVTT